MRERAPAFDCHSGTSVGSLRGRCVIAAEMSVARARKCQWRSGSLQIHSALGSALASG
jgi:hypothetical protein